MHVLIKFDQNPANSC